MDYEQTVSRLCGLSGPSGFEFEAAADAAEMLRPFVDEVMVDHMYSVIGVRRCGKKGAPKLLLDAHLDEVGYIVTGHKDGYLTFTSLGVVDPRILPNQELTLLTDPPLPGIVACLMFSAHMDAIGLIVTHIEKNGYLRIGKVGGVSPQVIAYTPVRFQNGVRGVIVPEEKAEFGTLKLDECYVDIGAEDKETAESMVRVGDKAVFDGEGFSGAGHIVSPCLDDRAACAVMIETLRRIGENRNDLYFVFTVQEEVGARGAKTAAWEIEPDYGIAVDVTDTDDTPGSRKNGTARLGGGAAIKILDHSVIAHSDVVKRMEQTAAEHHIAVQRDIMLSGGTDGGAIHVTRCGVRTGGISIPCRYVHSPVEKVSIQDLEACVRLAAAFAQADLPR